jgi:2-iminobutanoate/2-iminopropanoate deaminase
MAKREPIYVDSFRHANPTPAACRIGDLVMSGGIHGRDPVTGDTPDSLEEQLALTFQHVRTIVEAAGGTVGDIIKMTFWVNDRADRPKINVEWERMFPDPADRPTRHVMRGNLDAYMKVQCDFTAVVPPRG